MTETRLTKREREALSFVGAVNDRGRAARCPTPDLILGADGCTAKGLMLTKTYGRYLTPAGRALLEGEG